MSRSPPVGDGSSSYADTLGAYDGSDATTPRSAASSGSGRLRAQEELAKMDAAVEKSRAASPEPEPGAEARKQAAPQWSGPVVMKKPARSASKTQVIKPGSPLPRPPAAPPPPPPRTAPVAPPAPTYEMMQHMHSTKPSDADLQHGARRLKRGDLSFTSGRHYAEFRLVKGAPHVLVGVSKPDWESHISRGASGEVAIDDASDQEGHCFFYVANGRKFPGGHDWEGRRGGKQGDCIGMLLDMHQGSLAVYKNGELLGMMQRAGLTGELCWAIERHDEKTVVQLNRLDASDVPAAPSLSEQAAAAARHKQLKHVQTVEQPHLHESFAQKDLELRIEEREKMEEGVPPEEQPEAAAE